MMCSMSGEECLQIGIENIMWSSDYSHTASTWPHSQECIARDFTAVAVDEKRKIVRQNAIDLYDLGLE